MFDRPFWAVFLSIAILGTAIWLAIFEHNYHPRIYRCDEAVTILEVGDSELDFNHPLATLKRQDDQSSPTYLPGGRQKMGLLAEVTRSEFR